VAQHDGEGIEFDEEKPVGTYRPDGVGHPLEKGRHVILFDVYRTVADDAEEILPQHFDVAVMRDPVRAGFFEGVAPALHPDRGARGIDFLVAEWHDGFLLFRESEKRDVA